MTPEGAVKAHLNKRVREVGGSTRKLKWEGRRNAPDCLVTIPGVKATLVETKASGKEPTAAQLREHERLRPWFYVHWLNSKESVDDLISFLLATRATQ